MTARKSFSTTIVERSAAITLSRLKLELFNWKFGVVPNFILSFEMTCFQFPFMGVSVKVKFKLRPILTNVFAYSSHFNKLTILEGALAEYTLQKNFKKNTV